ncbi:hypothetical protein WV31_04950 [Magnetospirillum sp. ME-1]|uniref:DUF927 domain-containing protein n=1 Tax=Magnetospirillum sp. ME-1 TaxID=1639348 RepID=UPI000A17EDAC|nr:DUF927 domain-containing protein [Magnetospirillum sp. ME-1]ARJ65056.1 hypothetical protein WV31_04950 [Magnetospirillum sp. ME-1]
MNKAAMFEELSPEELASTGSAGAKPKEEWAPIQPVPDDVPRAFPRHRHGKPTAWWKYLDAEGHLLGLAVRFDLPDGGKDVLPLTYCEGPEGKREWRWKSFPALRPLYGLNKLATRLDAPVLVVEGEKAADAAGMRFPDYVVVTSPGGSKAAGKADWSPLKGRRAAIWPDKDEAGADYANAVAKATSEAGAVFVAIVDVPPDFPEAWDLADDVPPGHDDAELLALLNGAQPFERQAETSMPFGYSMRADGLYWQDPNDADKPAQKLSGPFEVLAETRDVDGNAWGVLLRWHDHDGRPHEWPMARAMLAGDGADARKLLLDGGLYVAPGKGARDKLTAFLASVQTEARARAVTRIGWHDRAFVLPNETFGKTDGERVLLQSLAGPDHAFNVRGSLDDWKESLARYAIGNSRLALALSAAFAPPLLYLAGEESGGINFVGRSRAGKTTILRAAGSVWGGGGVGGFIRTWRATDNGLEGTAEGHCDALLCLDEMGQIDPRIVGETAYMLANGGGKSRARRDGSGRKPAQWRLLFLSTGELSLAEKMNEAGKRPKAGQEVRLVDVPADAGAGMGIFEELHGLPTPEALSRHIKDASTRNYGEPCRAFLRKLSKIDPDEIAAAVSQGRAEFIKAHVPQDASGQVLSVAGRFALIAAAGTLATVFGILPWEVGEAARAAATCFNAWLERRGGAGAAEVDTGLAQIRRFLEAHGSARFEPIGTDTSEVRIINRVGFRKQDADGRWEFFVLPGAFKSELCAGLDSSMMAKEMVARGFIVPDKTGGKTAIRKNLPGMGLVRCYHIAAAFLEADGEGPANV